MSELSSCRDYVICPQVSDVTYVLRHIFHQKLSLSRPPLFPGQTLVYFPQLPLLMVGVEVRDQLLASVFRVLFMYGQDTKRMRRAYINCNILRPDRYLLMRISINR
jgi:hypothetical protein